MKSTALLYAGIFANATVGIALGLVEGITSAKNGKASTR